ncbi:minichromosome maintenance protein 5 (Cell division control protein 46) [Puccinia sorghi]|uniref:DNA replication licensing factor MCM5 n=1 Tax=Puccinia sorghi TaxID=27349 RepID=A0A0L6UXU5_9BASI|nr:minichromosome maintenance protein 5 (Cell division control protein 46) [Puccinia sorghi]
MPPFGFDRGSISVVPVLGSATEVDSASTHASGLPGSGTAPYKKIQNLRKFILDFRLGESFIYRDRLRTNLLAKVYAIEVELQHLIVYDEELAHSISNMPGELLPLFEIAVRKVAEAMVSPLSKSADLYDDEDPQNELAAQGLHDLPDFQVTLKSEARLMQFRDLLAPNISKLVRMPGIVISASTLSSRATMLHLMCKSCRHVRRIAVQGGFTGFTLPRTCSSSPIQGEKKECPLDPYTIVHEKSRFVDQQSVKLQEAPDMVPVGELPRHILLSLDRYLTGKVVPGSRIIATGIYSTFNGSGKNQGAIALRQPYLRVVGLEVDGDGRGSNGGHHQFSAEEEDEFTRMASSPGFYQRFAESIAPSIYGNEDIKKAVVCLLMGGSKKILPDGMRLRGDINVLLLGDPGTAKSQLLKFVEKVSPISVYTSGKGSSAAGLTASVQRDPQSREFYLEGGAMVLADGGVVCIDEFDKMRDEDRVAIHEAMEQQTISIAKAGITTILNSRTSVLAAANPVFGRYDDMKSPGENIDFQTTILSRFDMIFIVKDEHDELRDRTIARHVMDLHMNRAVEAHQTGEIDLQKMKRFITYARRYALTHHPSLSLCFRCSPRLSPEAAEELSSHFVSLRKQVQQVERDNNERSSIPITIRQLEAIIRISEAIAKLSLSRRVEVYHVEESIRLFKYSTMDAVQAGNIEGITKGELQEEMGKVEAELRRRLPIGWSTSYSSLLNEFVNHQGYSSHALERCLYVLERREVIRSVLLLLRNSYLFLTVLFILLGLLDRNVPSKGLGLRTVYELLRYSDTT